MDAENKLTLIEKLARLRESGVLTDEEFQTEKAKLLSDTPAATSGETERGQTGPKGIKRNSYFIWLTAFGAIGLATLITFLYATPRAPAEAVSKPVITVDQRQNANVGTVPELVAALPDLDRLLKFSKPSTCEPGPELEAIFSAMWSEGKKNINVPGFGTLTVAKSKPDKDGYVTISLPVEGTWLGLHVSRLVAEGLPESGFHWEQIRFVEPRSTILSMLQKQGFSEKLSKGEDGDTWVAVKDLPGGSALECGQSF